MDNLIRRLHGLWLSRAQDTSAGHPILPFVHRWQMGVINPIIRLAALLESEGRSDLAGLIRQCTVEPKPRCLSVIVPDEWLADLAFDEAEDVLEHIRSIGSRLSEFRKIEFRPQSSSASGDAAGQDDSNLREKLIAAVEDTGERFLSEALLDSRLERNDRIVTIIASGQWMTMLELQIPLLEAALMEFVGGKADIRLACRRDGLGV